MEKEDSPEIDDEMDFEVIKMLLNKRLKNSVNKK